eukprot:gene18877-22552_t
MTAAAKRKASVTAGTADAIEEFQSDSHTTFGEWYGAVVTDKDGTERDVDAYVGETVFEHATIGAASPWRTMGHPEIMRCHLVAADDVNVEGTVEALARFDCSVFHGDFMVESWTWEQLVEMIMKIVPAVRVKRNYEVGWKDEAGVERVLILAECRGNFGADRITALRTRNFWTAAPDGSTRMERQQTP